MPDVSVFWVTSGTVEKPPLGEYALIETSAPLSGPVPDVACPKIVTRDVEPDVGATRLNDCVEFATALRNTGASWATAVLPLMNWKSTNPGVSSGTPAPTSVENVPDVRPVLVMRVGDV